MRLLSLGRAGSCRLTAISQRVLPEEGAGKALPYCPVSV